MILHKIKLRKNKQSGATMVEIALCLPLFFLMLAFVIDLPLYFYGIAALENATRVTSELVRTGVTADITEASVRNSICSNLYKPLNCSTHTVVVQLFPTSAPPETNTDYFSLPSTNAPITIKIFTNWSFYFPTTALMLTGSNNGTKLIQGLMVVIRENFFPSAAQTGGLIWNP